MGGQSLKQIFSISWNKEDLLVFHSRIGNDACKRVLHDVYKEVGWKQEDCIVGYVEDGMYVWNLRDSSIWWVFIFVIAVLNSPKAKESFSKALPEGFFEEKLIPLMAETFIGKTLGSYKKSNLNRILNAISFMKSELVPIAQEFKNVFLSLPQKLKPVIKPNSLPLEYRDIYNMLYTTAKECVRLSKRLTREGCLKYAELVNFSKLKEIIRDELEDIIGLETAKYEKPTICLLCLNPFNTVVFNPALYCPACRSRYEQVIKKRIQRHSKRQALQKELAKLKDLLKEDNYALTDIKERITRIRRNYPEVFAIKTSPDKQKTLEV
jgi:hypothetical protein